MIDLLLPIFVLAVFVGATLAFETAAWSVHDPFWGAVWWHMSRVCASATVVMLAYLLFVL